MFEFSAMFSIIGVFLSIAENLSSGNLCFVVAIIFKDYGDLFV